MENRISAKKRWQIAVATGVLAFAFGAHGGSGYLESVGPAPFRIMPPLHPPPKIVRAPEPVEPARVVVVTNIVVAPAPLAITNEVSSQPQPQPVIATPPTNGVPTDDAVYPQMLLKYFNKGTGSSVYMPVTVPPTQQPGQGASSSASYTNAP